MPIGTSRSVFGAISGGGNCRGYFKHQVFEIGPGDILQREFVLDFVVVPESELVMYNLSVICPSEVGISRDYEVIDGRIIRLVPDFTLLPNDRIHIYYQLL